MLISWWWLIPAAMAGGTIGVLVAAMCAAAGRGEIAIPPGKRLGG